MFLASSQDSSSLLRWAAMLAAVSLPATAQRFFRAFLGDEAGPPPMSRITLVGAALLYLALLSSLFLATPVHTSKWFCSAFLTYVFLGLYLSVYYLYRRYRRTPSRVEKIRLLYLLVGGLATVTAAILDLVPWAPSVGNIFITIYLFFLSQTLVRYRLLDLNELLGRMVVLAALASISTIIYGLLLIKLVDLNEIGLLFLNALIASTAIIIVFEPLRSLLERVVNRWMFQEKYELFRRIESLRADLMNVIDVRDLVPRVLSALEDSRRVTHASMYIVDPDGSAYDLIGHVGPRPEGRIDAVAHRGFLERLRRAGWFPSRAWNASFWPCATSRAKSARPCCCRARAGAAQRLGGAGHPRRRAAARHAGLARRAPARGLFLGGNRALPRRRRVHRRDLAKLANLRAHEGARSSGGAGPDGGGPGARDPQSARLHQGRGPVPAAGRRPDARRQHARVPRHHRRGSRPAEQDRLAVPRLRAALPRRSEPARRQRRGSQDHQPDRKGAQRFAGRNRHEPARGLPPVRADAQQLRQVF
jgi:hypothetical protein